MAIRPLRRRLPRSRSGQTTHFRVASTDGYLTTGEYADGSLGEVFLTLGKQGSTLAGMTDAFSIAVSVALQYGVPVEAFVAKFVNMRFEPAGLTDDPDLPFAQSLADYIFRRIALDHLPLAEREAVGILTAGEREAQLSGAGH